MKLTERVSLLHALGQSIDLDSEKWQTRMQKAYYKNRWFSIDSIRLSLVNIKAYFLNEDELQNWIASYSIKNEEPKPKVVGLVTAGNLPLVGLQDWITIFISGHKSKIKLSSKDELLFQYLMQDMIEIDPRILEQHQIIERLSDFEAVIATGSNNSARYFEQYFGKYPNIIRKNRSSMAILKGDETEDELLQLGRDVFDYFGMGCRNVSKLYLPQNYDIPALLSIWEKYRSVADHDKYKNNFDYNLSIYLLNGDVHFQADYVMLKESTELVAPISVVYYQFYSNDSELKMAVDLHAERTQCVVGNDNICSVPFGGSQKVRLRDYADNVDTMKFLLELNE